MEKKDINIEIEPLLKDVDGNFEQIIKLCKPLIIYTISLVNYHPPTTKEELFHESTIELWRICKKYKKISVSFSAYFVHDLRNYLINYIQRNQFVLTIPYNEMRKKTYTELAHLANGKGGEEIIIGLPSDLNVERMMYDFEDDRLNYVKAHLSEQEWELIDAIVVQQDTLAEYGRQHGISREAARQRWLKLRRKMGII